MERGRGRGRGGEGEGREMTLRVVSDSISTTYLGRQILDLNKPSSWLHVTDLDEASGRGTGGGLLLLVESWPLGNWLRHGNTLTGTLLTSGSNVEPSIGRQTIEGEGLNQNTGLIRTSSIRSCKYMYVYVHFTCTFTW